MAMEILEFKPAAVFLLQIGFLVLAAKLGGSLFQRWKFPVVLGEIFGGFLIGPHLLGKLPLPGFENGLMANLKDDLTTRGPIFGVFMVALIILLFLMGLEADLRVRRSINLTNAFVGVFGGLLSFVSGSLITAYFSETLFKEVMVWYEPLPLFAGCLTATTSVGILARMLARKHLLETAEGMVALSGSISDNLLGIALLATASGVAESVFAGSDTSFQLALRYFGFALFAMAIAGVTGYLLVRFLNGLNSSNNNISGAVAAAAAGALICGGIFGIFKLSPLVGAYVIGIAFSTSSWKQQIQERVEFVKVALVPTTFAIIGAMIQPMVIFNIQVAIFAAIFLAGALLAKFIGCGLPAFLTGLKAKGCLLVGVTSMPRGEATLAIAAIALCMGCLPPELLMAVVVLLLFSGLIVPSIVSGKVVYDNLAAGVADSDSSRLCLTFTFPSPTAGSMVLNRAIELFENEGFYVQLLNRREGLYRLSRDLKVIGLQNNDGKVVFRSAESERELINTLMMEVGAGIEQNLRELRRAFDPHLLQKKRVDGQPEKTPVAIERQYGIKQYLSLETLRPRLVSSCKAGVIDELLDVLEENGMLLDRHEAGRAVFAREQGLSTGLEHGIAIPHGRTDAVDKLVCAVGLKPEGIDFGSLDGKESRIFVLVLAPLHAAAPQLQFISQITQTLNEQGRAALMSCDSAEDMLAILSGENLEVANRRKMNPVDNPLDCLGLENISLDLVGKSKEEVLEEMLTLCVRSGVVNDVEVARQALLARERKSSTGMELGIALPHARTEAVSHMVCACGISRAGIDFNSIDGQPSKIFIMTLAPLETAGEYSRLVGILLRALDEKGRQEIMAVRSIQDVLTVLRRGL